MFLYLVPGRQETRIRLAATVNQDCARDLRLTLPSDWCLLADRRLRRLHAYCSALYKNRSCLHSTSRGCWLSSSRLNGALPMQCVCMHRMTIAKGDKGESVKPILD